MTIDDVYNYYGTWKDAMQSLRLSRSAYSNWIKLGRIPNCTQIKIEAITNKELKRS